MSILTHLHKDELQTIIDGSTSYADVIRNLGLPVHGGNHITLKRRIKRDGLNLETMEENRTRNRPAGIRKGPINEISKEDLQSLLDESSSYKSVLTKIGYGVTSGATLKVLKRRIDDDNLDRTQFMENHRNWKKAHMANLQKRLGNRTPDEQVFVENSTYDRSGLKNRIMKSSLIPYVCSACNQGDEWNGMPLVLQLEHINGNPTDNRLENLTFLCPNCHTQTHTWGSKRRDKRKIPGNKTCADCDKSIYKTSTRCNQCRAKRDRKVEDRPSREELLDDLKSLGFAGTGRKYAISDNSIRKWCKSMDLPYTLKELKTYNEE